MHLVPSRSLWHVKTSPSSLPFLCCRSQDSSHFFLASGTTSSPQRILSGQPYRLWVNYLTRVFAQWFGQEWVQFQRVAGGWQRLMIKFSLGLCQDKDFICNSFVLQYFIAESSFNNSPDKIWLTTSHRSIAQNGSLSLPHSYAMEILQTVCQSSLEEAYCSGETGRGL